MGWREINPNELLGLRNPLIIDVRSPLEHAAEKVLGSVNIPLLSDLERIQVGVLYKEKGDLAARKVALSLISPKIPTYVEEVYKLKEKGRPVLIYCWRGGLRSEAVSSVLSIAGLECLRLRGGYKAWRNYVLGELSTDANPIQPLVIQGLTGVGKTEILEMLSKRGLPVLNLEALANHRGSAFGSLGKSAQPSQKDFEEGIWRNLKEHSPSLLIMEGEGRKIGRLAIPRCITNYLEKGPVILLEASLETRTRRIANEYIESAGGFKRQQVIDLLSSLRSSIGKIKEAEIIEFIEQDDFPAAISALLLAYYDPMYTRSLDKTVNRVQLRVKSDNIEECVSIIQNWLSRDLASVQKSTSPR